MNSTSRRDDDDDNPTLSTTPVWLPSSSSSSSTKTSTTTDKPHTTKNDPTTNTLQQSLRWMYRLMHFIYQNILLRPSVYVGLITFLAYYDNTALHGSFVYDDAGTIKTNVVVTQKVPWTDVFYRDFWGTLMTEIQSHKSFRPITTLSFLGNWMYAQQQLLLEHNITDITAITINQMNMFGFHIVNVILHCIATIFVTEATYYVFHSCHHHHPSSTKPTNTVTTTVAVVTVAQIITGSIFGLHPVHVEAVTNITSRGELFMSLFYLGAFLIYARTLAQIKQAQIKQQQQHHHHPSNTMTRIAQFLGIYVFPWIGLILSIFSKEQGATTLLTLILYDFLTHRNNNSTISTSSSTDGDGISIYQYLVRDVYQNTLRYYYNEYQRSRRAITTTADTNEIQTVSSEPLLPSTLSLAPFDYTVVVSSNVSTNLQARNEGSYDKADHEHQQRIRRLMTISFLRRAIVLLLQTAIVAYWRHWLNGITKPDFIYDQNPAGFASERTTRLYSIPYIYCLYIYDYLYPMYLGPDWSGASIDLITTIYDRRIIGVILLWIFTAVCGYTFLFGQRRHSQRPHQPSQSLFHDARRILLISFLAFGFCPFLLSSNLLVVVGLMKADRVMYLPLMGLALLETLLVMIVFYPDEMGVSSRHPNGNPVSKKHHNHRFNVSIWKLIGNVLVLGQLVFFAAKLHERNIAWSHSLNLWTAAYNLNPRSKHTMYNCGYELSLQQRYIEAEYVLRPIGNPHVDGPSNTFIYAMVLYNLQRCDEAVELIELALEVIEEKRRVGGPRNSASSLMRTKSNLLVAQGFCTMDQNVQYAGQIFYNAVQADPTNEYAIEQANKMVQRLEQLQLLEKEQRARMGL